jgi:hypothetical protein
VRFEAIRIPARPMSDCKEFPTEFGMLPRPALIARKQLNPYEEARAVKAMVDRGLTDQRDVGRNYVNARLLDHSVISQHAVGHRAIEHEPNPRL